MRKITKESVQAFIESRNFHSGNMAVETKDNTISMFLHDNLIAKREKGKIYISNSGWTSNTTKERLNGLLQELNAGYIYQKDFVWYWSKKEKSIEFPHDELIDTEINFLTYAMNK